MNPKSTHANAKIPAHVGASISCFTDAAEMLVVEGAVDGATGDEDDVALWTAGAEACWRPGDPGGRDAAAVACVDVC